MLTYHLCFLSISPHATTHKSHPPHNPPCLKTPAPSCGRAFSRSRLLAEAPQPELHHPMVENQPWKPAPRAPSRTLLPGLHPSPMLPAPLRSPRDSPHLLRSPLAGRVILCGLRRRARATPCVRELATISNIPYVNICFLSEIFFYLLFRIILKETFNTIIFFALRSIVVCNFFYLESKGADQYLISTFS